MNTLKAHNYVYSYHVRCTRNREVWGGGGGGVGTPPRFKGKKVFPEHMKCTLTCTYIFVFSPSFQTPLYMYVPVHVNMMHLFLRFLSRKRAAVYFSKPATKAKQQTTQYV